MVQQLSAGEDVIDSSKLSLLLASVLTKLVVQTRKDDRR